MSHDHELAPGWRHLAAVRRNNRLRLYVDGKQVSESTTFNPSEFDLTNDKPLKIGAGGVDTFNGRLRDPSSLPPRTHRGGDREFVEPAIRIAAGTRRGYATKPVAGLFRRTTMLKAGASKVNITPFLGGPMAGYSARDRGSESIHDELHAKALVLDDGDTGVALITTDLIGIHRELAAHVRRLVEARVGLAPDRVWMTGSHTHFGPAVRAGETEDDEADPYDRSYADVLAAKLTTAVKLAHDRIQPARLGAGAIGAEGISYNRRLIRHDERWK